MAQSKAYNQKYWREWESYPEFKGWLKPHVGDDTRAYCLYCKSDFYAIIGDVRKHMATKHAEKAKPYSATQSKLPVINKNILPKGLRQPLLWLLLSTVRC